jgi:5-methylcytosine-specific restriction protein A
VQPAGGKDHLEVHHVRPFHLNPALELLPTNFITLCESPGRDCHCAIGHLMDWKAFNPTVRMDAAWMLSKIKHRPYQE